MPRNPRIFIHNGYYEICFRTEQGLPLVCNSIIDTIFKGIVAKAATLYPVTLCKIMLMANHIHLGLVVQDPEHVHMFVSYLKRELSHAINRLLGRKRQTVWQESYDAVIILDTAKAVERSVYVYLNPARANLVEHASQYPGYNTWNLLQGEYGTLTAKRIPRDCIPKLPARPLSLSEQNKIVEVMLESAYEENTITIQPTAWLDVMPDGSNSSKETVRRNIVTQVTQKEHRIALKRIAPVIGVHALKLQRMNVIYRPKKRGKKSICFSSVLTLSRRFIEWYKSNCEYRKALKDSLPLAEFFTRMPPGFFFPGGRLLANLHPNLLPH